MSKEPIRVLTLPSLQEAGAVMEQCPFPIDFVKGRYSQVSFLFEKDKIQVRCGEEDIRGFTFVWLSSVWSSRDLAYAIRLYLKATNTNHSYVEKSTSKVSDTMHFALAHLPIPETVYMPLSGVKKNIATVGKICGYPLIIKDTKGAKGKHSQYIASEADLLEEIGNFPKQRKFLFQRYIPNDYDWGIMVVNGVVVSGEKSYHAKGEFRNNVCNGATEHFVDVSAIPQQVKDIAIQASASLGLSWSRADIIVDKNTGEPFLLEVNRYPGITAGSEEVIGASFFLKSHLLSSLKKKQAQDIGKII